MAERVLISIYRNFADTSDKDFALTDFINGVKSGKWQDDVLRIRTIQDKKERDKQKKMVPMVTVSGSFSGRKDSSIRKHSGFIAIDIDKIDNPYPVKDLLANDPFIYASFASISDKGLCLIFKIDGARHADAFEGIGAYLYQTYQLVVDQSCKNVSRSRFVSFDPYLIQNTEALLFKKYLPKPKIAKVNRVVFVKSDFDEIVTQMFNRGVNICEDYANWVSTAYALISEFGELGLPYFHTLSSMSGKYNPQDTDRQYETCLKSHTEGKSKTAHIGSIYYHAKQAGIDVYSATTKEIIRATSSQTKSGVSPEGVASYLKKFHQIEDALPVIKQVIEKDITHQSDNIIDDIQSLLIGYELKKNLVTRNIEINGKPIDDTVVNSIFIDIKSTIDKTTKDLIYSNIYCNRTPEYHPVKAFFEEEQAEGVRNLSLLLQSIKTDTPNYDKWVTKWLVSIIASVYGTYSPLTLVLAGEKQGTGKSHFFRYLLPKRLRYLYGESSMDDGKDDEILMTKKLIILDDEYGGKSKKEYTKMKKITSKEFVNVREPYTRLSVDLRRMAMFCGTSNDLQILNDPTGNRRVIPIRVLDIDRSLYNQCDKEELLRELYTLYKEGFDFTVLQSDIKDLNDNTDNFKVSSPEEELIMHKLMPGTEDDGEWMNITLIIQYLIDGTKINSMSNTKIGMILNSMGFVKRRKWMANNTVTAFLVKKTLNDIK